MHTTQSSSSISFDIVSPDRNPASHDRNALLLRELHGGVMTSEFDDLEEVEIWLRMVSIEEAADCIGPCIMYFIVARDLTRPQGDQVIGGCSIELYKASGFGLVAYLAVDRTYRNRGIAKQLIEMGNAHLGSRSLAVYQKPLTAFVLLVVEASDELQHREEGADYDHEYDPRARQEVWRRLNFTPVDFTFVCPGRLKGLKHQLAVRHHRSDRITTALVKTFLDELFQGILAEENNFTDENGEIAAIDSALIAAGDYLPIGNQYWR